MAKVQKAILTEYTNDGSVVMSNIRKGKTDLPVIGNNETYSATLVTEWYDGSPMDDSKADGAVYLKYKGTEYPNYTGSYFRVNLPNFGELFLEKDTVAQMRDLSSTEILLLKMGYYKGVKLNGYYEKQDTPAPIEYLLSDTVEVDDGGSVFEVGGIKLEHEFIGDVDIRYFGAFDTQDVSDVLIRLNSIAKVTAAILPNNCILKISKRVNISNISLLGGTNTVIQVVTSGIIPLWFTGYKNKTVSNITFDGISTYSIRTTGINEIISDNNSVVSTLGLVGSSANTARQWNNSWNSSPIFEQPFYRNDNVVFGQDASIVPEGFWTSSKSITMSTISAGIGFPNSVGLLISYQNGGGETSGNYTRSFDIFKNYNEDGLYVRRYSPSGVPLPFRRLDNISAAASADSAPTPSETYTQAEVQAILTELRDLKTKLRTAGILAT